MYKSEGLIEQHFHGAFGVNFMNCSVGDIVDVSVEILKYGVTRIYPTLMTDDLSVIKTQIAKVKNAMEIQPKESAKISGIHLEGPFINPQKSGIHEKKYILTPNIENYQKIEDEIIKIVTVSPELDERHELCGYLRKKGVKVSAGHTLASDLSCCDCATHLFNAMGCISHKTPNTVTSALVNDDMYVEVIADGNHIVSDVLKLIFKTKPLEKTILISDALPPTASNQLEGEFAGQKIYFKNCSFYGVDGTLGGSGLLVCQIIRKIVSENLISASLALKMASSNILNYLSVDNNGFAFFDNDLNVLNVEVF